MTSLPILLIQLQGIDKNMKLIWLKGVKEPTGECHKQWMVAAWRKINDRGWSQTRVLLGSVTLFLEKSCLLALVVWSKGKLENLIGLMKEDTIKLTTEIKTLFDFNLGGCYMYALSEGHLKFAAVGWLSISILHSYYICRIVIQSHSDFLRAFKTIVVTF